jgi:hypothetical protein
MFRPKSRSKFFNNTVRLHLMTIISQSQVLMKLYFDFDIDGVDASQLTWEPVTHEGITATVQWKIGKWDGWFDGSEDVLRVYPHRS